MSFSIFIVAGFAGLLGMASCTGCKNEQLPVAQDLLERSRNSIPDAEGKLVARSLRTLRRHRVDLDNSTLGKLGNYAAPCHTISNHFLPPRPASLSRPASLHHSPLGFPLPHPGQSALISRRYPQPFRTEAAMKLPMPELTQLRNSLSEKPRIVLLGGGFGGLYAALKLAKFNWGGGIKPDITLIDSEDRFLFQPLMYELITGEATVDQVAPPFKDLLGDTGVHFLQQEGVNITIADPDRLKAGRIHMKDGIIDYDWLVLGVGAKANLDFAAGAREHAIPFATLHDVNRLEKELQDIERRALSDDRMVNICVVGGGASGVEIAATVAQRLSRKIGKDKTKISIYVAGSDLMETFAKNAREAAKRELAAKGVTVYYNHFVEEISVGIANGDTSHAELQKEKNTYTVKIRAAGATEAENVSADLVLWTAGFKPVRVGGLLFLGKTRGPVNVEPTLRIQGREREFALGDVASLGFPATAQVAMQQAYYCARNVYASIKGKPLRNFRYLHLGNLVMLGSLEGTATVPFPLFGDLTLTGPLASAARKFAYIYRQPTTKQMSKVAGEWLRKPALWVPNPFAGTMPMMLKHTKNILKLFINPFAGTVYDVSAIQVGGASSLEAPLLQKLYNEDATEDIQDLFKDIVGRSDRQKKQ